MFQWAVRCGPTVHQYSVALVQHQHSGVDLGLCQRQDCRELMSSYSLYGATTIARDRAQSEPWDLGDDWLWWYWYPGGLVDDKYIQRSVWDLGTEGTIHDRLTQRQSITQWFIWDPGIGSPEWSTGLDCLRASNLGVGGLSCPHFFSVFIVQSGWISRDRKSVV